MRRLPQTQGDRDGLCGLYAISNTFEYLFPRFPDSQLALIWQKAALSIKPWPQTMWKGTEAPQLWLMLETAAMGRRVRISRPFRHKSRGQTFDDFFEALHKFVRPDTSVAIIGLDAPYDHWTVAKTVKGRQIVLQDSCKLHLINRSEAGLPGSRKRWKIDPKCTFFIERA